MLDVVRTSSHKAGGQVAILPLVGTEADLGAVLIRMARMAAAVHMAEAARLTPDAPARTEARMDGAAGSGA